MKQRSTKSLQTTFLCYSDAKSTLKVLLNFNMVEKAKLENLDFVHLSSFFIFLSSSPALTQKVYCVCEY